MAASSVRILARPICSHASLGVKVLCKNLPAYLAGSRQLFMTMMIEVLGSFGMNGPMSSSKGLLLRQQLWDCSSRMVDTCLLSW